MRDAFSDCHPAVNFIFYAGAFVMGMCFLHPIFSGCSLVLSMMYYIQIKKDYRKYIAGMFGLIIALTFLNPLFNTRGEHVLFTYLGDRNYTLEALCYGIVLAAMFVTVLTWFATYNEVMTSDKFLYCFGKMAPSISLILTMVLRMVPSFQKKAQQIGGARRCIGKSVENGTKQEKMEHGMVLISALTSWALEGGVVMADSMQSRGYGTGKRTSFSIYRMRKTDQRLLCLMVSLMVVILICKIKGGMQASYVPVIEVSWFDQIWMMAGTVSYGIFLAIPAVMHITEEIKWHILKSKI